ncbi:hypothetical protein HZA99_06720 [Candidatus Woesearchaeota archaeon]|nr:hypothetical protein [Candidatus Woesearchaeota archaeon]
MGINITYETLFDVLRAEKRREDIQQLPQNFFQNLVAYMKQKKEIIVKREHESGIENYDEIKKLNIQFENVQKIIKEIYERREKKILMVALNKSRTRASTVPMEYLLPQEQEFCEQTTRLLDAYRGDVAEKLAKGILPKEQIAAVMSSQQSAKHILEMEKESSSVVSNAGVEMQDAAQDMAEDNVDVVKIKFLQETEEFVGPELEVYGPFAANTIAAVPAKIASVFLESGLAEEMK